MAIFSGNWKDENGIPFASNAYQCQDYGASGTAQSTNHIAWGSALQRQAAYRFTVAAYQWTYDVSLEERAAWTEGGEWYNWRERQGYFGNLPGYRLWLRSQIPTMASGVEQQVEYPDFGEPWDVDWIGLRRESGGGKIWIDMRNKQQNVEERSHIEVFQIDPEYVYKSYEVKMTRLVGSVYGWLNGVEYTAYAFDPAWVLPSAWSYRIFMRWWNVHLVGQRIEDSGPAP